jgi:dolichyl-phosphate-mannose--protein O-mannosyl transferase
MAFIAIQLKHVTMKRAIKHWAIIVAKLLVITAGCALFLFAIQIFMWLCYDAGIKM